MWSNHTPTYSKRFFFLRYSVLEILKTLQKIKKCLYVHEIERKSIIMKHLTFIIKIMMHWISSKDNSCVIIYNDQNINIPLHNLSASSKKSNRTWVIFYFQRFYILLVVFLHHRLFMILSSSCSRLSVMAAINWVK